MLNVWEGGGRGGGRRRRRRRRRRRSYDNPFFSFCFLCCAQCIVHYFTLKLKNLKLSLSISCKYGGEVQRHPFLTSSLDADEWSHMPPRPHFTITNHYTTLLLCGKYHLPHCIANEVYGLGCGPSSLCPIAATRSRLDMEPLKTPIQFVPSALNSGIKGHSFWMTLLVVMCGAVPPSISMVRSGAGIQNFVKSLFQNPGFRRSHVSKTGRTAVEADTSAQSYIFTSRCLIRQMERLTCAGRVWGEATCRYGSVAVTRRVLFSRGVWSHCAVPLMSASWTAVQISRVAHPIWPQFVFLCRITTAVHSSTCRLICLSSEC